MTVVTLSYSQSLRAIGQALEMLRIDTFTLEKSGEKYVVRNWEPSFLKSITERVWGPGDTNRLEALGRSRRGSDSGQESHNLSLFLRVVGDYLDRRRAVAFDISWDGHAVKVQYQTRDDGHKEKKFTLQNLHDLGVGMYLRRSNRQVASQPTK